MPVKTLKRYASVQTALKDARLSSRLRSVAPRRQQTGTAAATAEWLKLLFPFTEEQKHHSLRRHFDPILCQRIISELEIQLPKLTDQLLTELDVCIRTDGSADWVEVVASRLGPAVLQSLCRLPAEEWTQLEATAALLLQAVNAGSLTAAEFSLLADGVHRFRERFTALRQSCLGPAHREAGLIELLIRHDVDFAEVSPDDLIANILFLVAAARENTAYHLSSSMQLLLDHASEYELLRRRPALVASAVEEILRFSPPARIVTRVALADLMIGGQMIWQGETVHLSLADANRDEQVFSEPAQFRVCRSPNPHLAFGAGPHVCSGARLLRAKSRVLIQRLLARPAIYAMAEPPRPLASPWFSGLETLRLTFR